MVMYGRVNARRGDFPRWEMRVTSCATRRSRGKTIPLWWQWVLYDRERQMRSWGIRYEARSRGRSSPGSLAFVPAKRSDNRADYCLGCSFLP